MTDGIGFGIDIGGSGIKGAQVDLATGELVTARVKIPTPKSYDIDEVIGTVLEVATRCEWEGTFGCTFPGVVHNGVLHTAANLGEHWIGVDMARLLSDRAGRPVTVLNDADAAGVAEMAFGAGKDHLGTAILTTLGTGIGTALFRDGILVPNTEFGHLEIDGHNAESQASSAAKTREGLTYKEYSVRLQRYYEVLEFLLSPDLILVGGGISRKSHKFLPRLKLNCEIIPATLENQAGIAGAAMAAAK
ncbi:MAG: polyphosphate--glucose phosphotransferase [Candidatus Nanopelagicales bacterium]